MASRATRGGRGRDGWNKPARGENSNYRCDTKHAHFGLHILKGGSFSLFLSGPPRASNGRGRGRGGRGSFPSGTNR